MMDRQVEHLAPDRGRPARRVADHPRQGELRGERLDLGRLARAGRRGPAGPAFEAAGRARSSWTPPDGPVWVDGDPTRLAQVLDNLLHNAIKFTDRGGPVTVAAWPARRAGGRRWPSGTPGSASSRSMLPRLFEPFTQADRSLDRSKGGLGLGLALVKGLVELHGGDGRGGQRGPGQGGRVHRPPAACRRAGRPDRGAGRPAAADGRRLPGPGGRGQPGRGRQPADAAGAVRVRGGGGLHRAGRGGGGGRGSARTSVAVRHRAARAGRVRAWPGALRQHPETAKARLIAVTGYGPDGGRREGPPRPGSTQHLTKPVDPQELLENLVFAR